MSFSCSLRARYAETDQMGVVYHANYLSWFDLARTEYLRALGHSYRQAESLGIMLPVAEVNCRYLAPAHYDDELEIEVKLTALGAATLCFSYQVSRPADAQVLAIGQTRQAFVGKDMRPLNCKRHYPEFWTLMQSQLES